MGIQSNDLSALALGITGDVPPTSLQPQVRDGVHIRYASSFAKGIPWYGYYLFRRPRRTSVETCLGSELAGLKPSQTGNTRLDLTGISFTSAAPIELVERPGAPGTTGIALPSSGSVEVRFDKAPLHRAVATIVFGGSPQRDDAASGTALFTEEDGAAHSPVTREGVTLGSDLAGSSPHRMFLRALMALLLKLMNRNIHRIEVALPVASDEIVLTVAHPGGALTVAAYDRCGAEIAAARATRAATPRSTLTLCQPGIARLRLKCAGGPLRVHSVSYRARGSPAGAKRTVRIVAKDGDAVVAETLVSGWPGESLTGEVDSDRITSVELHAAAPPSGAGGLGGAPVAALGDLCWDSVATAVAGDWAPVPNHPNPIALPVAEPTYPCDHKPPSKPAAEAEAIGRVRYGPASAWGESRFDELHDVLVQLVAGGPGGGPMSGRTATFADAAAGPAATPALIGENLLQILQLAAIDPAMAQILGLYWLDDQAVPGQAYDYAVLADHGNVFQGDPAAAQNALEGGAVPDGADAWILFNQVAQPRPPLAPPARPTTYVLPDTAVGATGLPRGAVGLNWATPSLDLDYLPPDAAVSYIAWRHDHGATMPGAPASLFTPLNPAAPYLIGTSAGSSTAAPLRPPHWPPFDLNAVDRGLGDGWYGYALSGIDIWGRHSQTGPPAEWRQWAPAPDPQPWYYQLPAADRQLHGFAVHILDKTPPPPPAAVEATALDPEDDFTYVRDSDYLAWWGGAGGSWWSGLTEARRAGVLPLRVRWRWYPVQEAQHPDTAEFRIYFNPGSVPPDPDRFVPTNWQERIFVCNYHDHCKLVPASDPEGPYRQYEVLLPLAAPPPSSPSFPGVALKPSLAQPVVYANISVSAADSKAHGADQSKWSSTPWGGRTGNEGRLAAAAKIYRVWRALPPAPTALINDDRVWATKADYHSHSFYSFRWAASPHLKAHVYAVMDSSLFLIERTGPDSALSAADQAALATVWPAGVPSNVTAELGALRAVKASLSNAALTEGDPKRRANDKAWEAACLALGDGALRGLAVLPLHAESYVRQTVEPVDGADAPGPDDPAGYVPNGAWRMWRSMFDGRARNRYFLRAAYIDSAHNEGPTGPPTPPIYLPPAVPPRRPVITRVTGGDRQATIAWATAGAEAGGRYVLYRTDDDYRLRDVRLMEEAAVIFAADLDPNLAEAEWSDAGLEGGKAYHYCLAFIDAAGNVSAPSKSAAVNVVDDSLPEPPTWIEQSWLLEHQGDNVLIDWPDDGIVPADHAPVLRLGWVTSVKQPVFVLTRREHDGRFWSAPPGAGQIVESATEAGEFSWIDRDADPARHWEYRLRVRGPTGAWSTEYDDLGVGRPDLAE
ncbi:MAG TPA: hypothetical protein VF603_02020 [Allosphingosinicella sp.]